MQVGKNKKEYPVSLPTTRQLEQELRLEKYKKSSVHVFRSTIFTLVTVAAVAVLIAVLLLPVLQIYGTSMSPTLTEGNIVLSVKGSSFETGDVVAFYYNNKILVKRVIAQSGQWVDISKDGTVYVDDIAIDEPYLTEKALGECDLELPYQVPESKIFVMGDHRSASVDSRSSTIGCIAEEQIVGKIVFRVWPLNEFGFVD
ncbi:MAG: signal peptidase I [Eubacteriales bacterium]|nr:signal peptidase I [Eubacteriales bacterium]